MALSAGVLAWTWLVRDAPTQKKVIATLAVGLLTTILLLVWSLLLARFRGRVRWSIAGGLVAVIALGFTLLDVKGFTGDLVPIVGWRYSSKGATELPVASGRSPASVRPLLDYPQYLGPERDAEVRGVALERDWSARPPKELWRREVGAGWSGFAVAGDAAFTQEQRGVFETVVCYDLATGDVRWVHSDEAGYDNTIAGDGPRATPTVTDEHVFTLGATGILNCLARADGTPVWSRNVLEDNGATNPVWGLSGSPLVTGGLVVVNAGGPGGRSLVAYDAGTGERAWSGGSDGASYASPQVATLAGAPQVLIFNHASMAGHDPDDGRVLWELPWSGRNPNVAQLVPVGDDAFVVAAGYGDGCARYRIARDAAGAFAATEEWRTRSLKSKFANFVHRDGSLFGLDDGILTCVGAADGKRRWKGGRYGHGQPILVGDVLLVMAETGDVVLVEATPEEHRELASLPVFADKTWNTPALAAPYLLVRNDVEAACLELPLRR